MKFFFWNKYIYAGAYQILHARLWFSRFILWNRKLWWITFENLYTFTLILIANLIRCAQYLQRYVYGSDIYGFGSFLYLIDILLLDLKKNMEVNRRKLWDRFNLFCLHTIEISIYIRVSQSDFILCCFCLLVIK